RTLFLILLFGILPPAGIAGDISATLRGKLPSLQAGQKVPVIVTMKDKVDLSRFRHVRSSAPGVIRALQEKATRSQGIVKSLLAREGYTGKVRSFWINNSLALDVDNNILEKISRLPEVEHIDFDEPVYFSDDGHGSKKPPRDIQAAEWNI